MRASEILAEQDLEYQMALLEDQLREEREMREMQEVQEQQRLAAEELMAQDEAMADQAMAEMAEEPPGSPPLSPASMRARRLAMFDASHADLKHSKARRNTGRQKRILNGIESANIVRGRTRSAR